MKRAILFIVFLMRPGSAAGSQIAADDLSKPVDKGHNPALAGAIPQASAEPRPIRLPIVDGSGFVAHNAMLTGILKVAELPPQCTFWRFLASLHLGVARQLLVVQQRMRERVWEAAHVKLSSITLDTDTTVHTLYGRQMGGRKS
jgi:hypothetical protein